MHIRSMHVSECFCKPFEICTTLHCLLQYCDPKYDFPKQEEVVQQIVQAVKLEEFNTNSAKNAGTLFLFGTYTIGKVHRPHQL